MARTRDPRVEVKIKLPRYLVEFLSNITREFAMDEGQYITIILTYFYEVYNKGYDKGYEDCLKRKAEIKDLGE